MNTRDYSTPTTKYKLILSAVHMVYRLVNATFNRKELILRLTRLLCQFIKANSSSIYVLSPKDQKVAMIAIFDNKINIFLNKKKDTSRISKREERVLQGYVVFEPHLIGLPMVSDENVGAIFVRRQEGEPEFTEFDKEMLSVFAEQSVTALKNLQFHEEQQKIILESLKFIRRFLKRHGPESTIEHMPVYFKIVRCLAEEFDLGQNKIEGLYYVSILRESGAIDIPYDILSKSGYLTHEESKIIRAQPAKNVELVKPLKFLEPVLPILLYHHERYDGSGYPVGLKKDQIPLEAGIVGIVEAFEAMVTKRVYRKRLSVEDAIAELKRGSGTQFDPKLVGAFIKLCKRKKFRNYLNSVKG